MINAHIFILLAFASVFLLPGSSFASCCYSFNYQPLPSTSPYYKANNDGPPAYSLSLTASSQYAVDSPGQSYLALISFPSNYVISAIPAGCLSVTITSVSCTSSGTNQLMANFGNIFIVDGNFNPLDPASVAVNGEQCICQQSCPIFTPSHTISPSTTTSTTKSSSTSTSSSSASTIISGVPTQTECPPCTASNSPCITPTTSPEPTTSMSKNSSNTGLIIGLAFALTLLVLLAAIYILRRHRKGDLFFFGIKRKGSKISMSRGNSGNSDIGNIESGYGHITSETVNNTEAVAVINDSQSSTSISQTTSHEQTPSEAAEDAAWGLMSSGYSANVTSTSRSTEPSYVAAKVLPRDTNQIGTILVDIPEVSETSESHLSEVDFFENENGEAVSVTNNSVSGGGELPRASTITLGQQLVHTTIESSKPTKRKKSRLHRAVSTASSKLAFWSTESKEKTRLGRVGSTTSTSTSSRHFPAGFKITSDPNAPPHIQNIQRASSNPNRSVIATIRPEHHQQLLRQIQLEQDIDTEEQSDQDSGSSRDMPRYPLVLKSSGKQYSGFDQQSGIGLVSSKDAFVNPGPPPLPPPARSRSNLHINIKSGASSNLKRGLTQPAHARTQRSRAAPTAEEHAAKSGAHNPGLYGYM